MKNKILLLPLLAAFSLPLHAAPFAPYGLEAWTGEPNEACEAISCLHTTTGRPSECNVPLRKFYSIHHKYGRDTISARRRFLQKCPASKEKDIAAIIEVVVHR